MRRPVVLAFILVLTTASPAAAYIPENTPHRNAEAAARTMLAEPATAGASVGVVIMRGRKEIFSINGGVPFTPASIIKLATTTTAMLKFGPDHRFATRAVVTATGSNVATLYMVGGGDPTLTNEVNRRKWFLPKPTDKVQRPAFASGSPTIEQLAARIADAGVRSVDRLVADDSLFDSQRKQAGWIPKYFDNDPETGLLSGLTVNEGFADLDQHKLLASPALGAGQALAVALRARGVSIGSVVTGRAPSSAPEIARIESPPLHEIIDFTNRYSINFDAEMLLKSVGASFGGAGSTAAGVSVIKDTLRALGVQTDGLVMTDGSGLSLLDRVTPRTITGLLEVILTRRGPGWSPLRGSIPVAGRPGTLLMRLTGPPTGGNFRGKTGQIEHVRGMAGWVRASDGVPLVYVAIFNHTPHPFALTAPLDVFGLLLALFPG